MFLFDDAKLINFYLINKFYGIKVLRKFRERYVDK